MIVKLLSHPICAAMAARLEQFERQFTYPLGPVDTFSISHGSDYLSFFAAMGPAMLLVAEDRREVAGTMVIVRRQLAVGNSGPEEAGQPLREVHYLCDLKVRPDVRHSSTLFRLLQSAADVIRPRHSHACYAIVMSGTRAAPDAYSGRLGIPKFTTLAEVAVIRFMICTSSSVLPSTAVFSTTLQRFEDNLNRLQLGGLRATAGEPNLRSLIPVERFIHGDGSACGMLEDTRSGKRLYRGSGEEIVSAHLSRFGWTSAAAAADVLKFAAAKSRDRGYPALFCSMPLAKWSQLKPSVHDLEYQETSAKIYGYELPAELQWWIDTSEI